MPEETEQERVARLERERNAAGAQKLKILGKIREQAIRTVEAIGFTPDHPLYAPNVELKYASLAGAAMFANYWISRVGDQGTLEELVATAEKAIQHGEDCDEELRSLRDENRRLKMEISLQIGREKGEHNNA